MAQFSGALRLTDLNDFIGPSQDCILPVKIPKITPQKPHPRGRIKLEGSREVVPSVSTTKKTTISLSDCLACSGCVTSAETILIQSQSTETLIRFLKERRKEVVPVVTLSPQTIASTANKLGLNFMATASGIIGTLKSRGFEHVFSSVEGNDIAHVLGAKEFLQRRKESKTPVLASACPGWICYAEKTHGALILPYISKIRSPQSILGALVKTTVSRHLQRSISDIYHVSLMPCFDKKLEASRTEFKISKGKDIIPEIDLVLSTAELWELWGEDIRENCGKDVDHQFTSVLDLEKPYPMRTVPGGTSGSFSAGILRTSITELWNGRIPVDSTVDFKVLRNKDLREAKVTCEGETISFVQAYGFRNIQNIINKIKTGRCSYDYVEIMACPNGCVNGGGQIVLQEKCDIERVQEIFESVQNIVKTMKLDDILSKFPDVTLFETSYNVIEKSVSAISTQW